MQSLDELLDAEDDLHRRMDETDRLSPKYAYLQEELETVCRAIINHPDHHANRMTTPQNITVIIDGIDKVVEMLATIQEALKSMALDKDQVPE
jgi:hypothetical protein